MAQESNSGLGRFVVEVSRSHTTDVWETSERLIILSQRPLSLQNTTNIRDGHPCQKPAIQEIWRPQTDALDSTTTEISTKNTDSCDCRFTFRPRISRWSAENI